MIIILEMSWILKVVFVLLLFLKMSFLFYFSLFTFCFTLYTFQYFSVLFSTYFFFILLSFIIDTCWIVDGNYTIVRPRIFRNATVIIWLDYHSHVIYPRLTRRIFRRVLSQEELWNGNKESLWKHFFTKVLF